MNKQDKTKDLGFKNCLVIGGSGLLGFEIAKQLHQHGANVRILDLVAPPSSSYEHIIGDIRHRDTVLKACRGIETVFQTAAAVWDPKNSPQLYDTVNVEGNAQIIDVCRKLGISRLVYTSTLDVVVEGKKPISNGDESLAYPQKMPADHYSRTKILAEKMVLEANGSKLKTCSLRPVGMYGPRDKYHLKNILDAVCNGGNFKLGDGSAKFSHVYSENAAHAHILAAQRLVAGSPVCGNFYFITDDCPSQNLFAFMAPFIAGLGLEPPKKSIPYPLAYMLAFINEKMNPGSTFNRFAVVQTCVDHTFVSSRAEKDLGYAPIVSKEEAFKRTLAWFAKHYPIKQGKKQ